MILNFPDLDTIQLALTSGAVPASVAMAPAVAGFGDDGRVWLEPSADPPKKALAELRRLGAAVIKAPGPAPAVEVSSWLELLPLQRSADPVARPEQTPVLFELPEGEQLSALVTEVLRLGNDRQGYRWLEDPKGKSPGRALLRVVGPPYYSLLRAIDRDGQASAPTAYVEQAPRVWVQVGHRHPLAEHVKPPAGQLLLLRPPRRWVAVEDAPFRDIYEVLEFTLPGQKARWREGELGQRLTVPLRLTRGGFADAAELWVLRENPVDQLDELVRGADDLMLDRLAFAVGEKGGEKAIVLRVRPSKQAPPALQLNAVGFRQHQQKVTNLFLPVGTRLSPPLRRDAVRKVLAADPAEVTWLYPEPDGGFTPESLPETAFRQLRDWIYYVLEHEHEPLKAWVEAARFDFEQFVCEDDGAGDRPKKPPKEQRAKAPPRPPGAGPGEGKFRQAGGEADKADGATPNDEVVAAAVATPPDELRLKLDELEKRFLKADGGLDATERQALWPEMAALNSRAGMTDDAGVCWMNALWAGDRAAAARALDWFRAEARTVPVRKESGWPKGRTWASAAALAPRGAAVDGAELDLLLKLSDPDTADVRALAAYVFWAGSQQAPPESLSQRLGKVGQFFEAHEAAVPVRAAWLAALGLHRLAGGDALGLARARDRLLERLFRIGLRPEQDLPSFLRFSGPAGNQRFRAVRQWLAELCDRAREWVRDKGRIVAGEEPKTAAYADLFFAFGLAKLGETDACHRLRERAKAELGEAGVAHQFLLEAYEYRIRRALDGQPHAGPLPAEQMEYLALLIEDRKHSDDKKGVGPEYVIDRLRWLSRILEPDQRIDPYRDAQKYLADLERAVRELPDVLDRDQVAQRVRGLLLKVPRGPGGSEDRAKILRAALDQGPRVGEAFSVEMLGLTPAAFDALPPPAGAVEFADQAELLEKGLFVAAHFDQKEFVQQLVTCFGRLLQTQRDAPTVQALDSLAAQSFRGLRKLGMQQEIDRLLRLMAEVLLKDRDLRSVENPAWRARHPAALRALLHVAAGWYYIGHYNEAETVLRAARAALLAPLPAGKDGRPALTSNEVIGRTDLARAYAVALSQAPVEVAQKRFEELFDKLEGILDTFTTNSYYSRCQLQIIEAVVLAVVSDDFTVGAHVRRWLDDDEYLVRRRVHRDVRELVSH
jgi:hypothetical protein